MRRFDAMLKFAVVREDWRIERSLIERSDAAVLVVASGGCTALALKHGQPALQVEAFDVNPDQLAHAQRKALAIARSEHTALNIHDASEHGLSQRGEFEKLFRVLRSAWRELVAPGDELEAFFSAPAAQRLERLRTWQASPYWSSVFEVGFGVPLLHAMFGPDATRHAANAYPPYFQAAFERGLAAPDAAENPWLEHVLLQRYQHPSAFLTCGAMLDVRWHLGTLTDVPDLSRFDVVSLSNVFDWSDASLVQHWARALSALKPGARVVWRQLNNDRDWTPCFEGFEAVKGPALVEQERSMFYERVTVLRRR